jgi:hypothetical protein
VLAALRLILTEAEYLRPKLRAIVLGELRSAQRDNGDMDQLKAEQAKIERQMGFLLDDLDEVGRSILKQKMTAMQNRLKEIRGAIRRARSIRPTVADADLVVENVCERLGQLGEELPSLPAAAARSVLQQFVSKLVVDLETSVVSH